MVRETSVRFIILLIKTIAASFPLSVGRLVHREITGNENENPINESKERARTLSKRKMNSDYTCHEKLSTVGSKGYAI